MEPIVLITGGGRGIGAATARCAATAGYKVAVNYEKRRDSALEVVSAIEADGGHAIAVGANVSVEDDVVRMFDLISAELGPLTALVNCAGILGEVQRVVEFNATNLKRMMEVNIVGTMLCCREAAKRMANRHGGEGGAIVNVTSMAATIGGRPGNSAYAASKAAIDSFTIGFAREVAREGIRVNAVRPGVTLTDMTASVRDNLTQRAVVASTIAMNRVAVPDEIAKPIIWLLSKDASFVSGCLMDISGGGFIIGVPNTSLSQPSVQDG